MNLQPILNRITPIKVFGFSVAGWASAFLAVCLWEYTNPNGLEIALSWGQFSAHMVSNVMSLIMVAAVTFFLAEVLVYMGPKVARVIYNTIQDERAKRDAGFTLRTYRYEAKPPHVFIHTLLGEKEHETLYRLNKALEETTQNKGCVLAMFKGSEMLETIYAGRHWATVTRPESGLMVSTYDPDFRFTDEDDTTYFQAVEEVGRNWKEKAHTFAARLAQQVNEEKSPLMIAARFAMSLLLVLLFPLAASAGIVDEIRRGTPEAETLVPKKDVTFCFAKGSFNRPQTGQKPALELLEKGAVPYNDEANVGEYIGMIFDGKLHQAVHANTKGKQPEELASLPKDSTAQRKTLKETDEEVRQWIDKQNKDNAEWSNSLTIKTVISGLVFLFLLVGMWAKVFHGEAMLDQYGQYIFGSRFGSWANVFSFFTGAVGLVFVSILLLGVWWNAQFKNDYWWAVRYIFSAENLPLLATLVYRVAFQTGLNWLIPNNRRAHVDQSAPRTFSNHRQLGPGGN